MVVLVPEVSRLRLTLFVLVGAERVFEGRPVSARVTLT